MRQSFAPPTRRALLVAAWFALGTMQFLASPSDAAAQATQTAAITGRITDVRTGDPVPNATAQIEGTRLAGVAGPDGRYRIANVPAGARSLIVLRLGYASLRKSVTVVAGQDQTVDFGLQASAVSLDQVVVTGTAGEAEKRSIGNAVSTIDASTELQKSAAPDLTNLLRYRSPGVDIQPVAGRVGAGPSIQIRGPSSIGLGNSPLVYIDGIRVNSSTGLGPAGLSGKLGTQGAAVGSRLNDLNPDDIESIEIVKGPAATTIYGTEASNGVIQVITKKGAGTGSNQVNAQVSAGSMWFQDAANRVGTNYDKDKTGTLVLWNGVTAAQDSGHPLFKTGLERHYDVAVAGGRDQARYRASIGYQNDYGIEPNNSQRAFNAHLNLSTLIGPTTDVSTSLNFVDMSSHLGTDNGESALLASMVGHILVFPASAGYYPNYPVAVPQTLYDNAIGTNRFTGSTTLNNQLTHWFTQRAVLGIDYAANDRRAIEHYAPPDLAKFLPASAATGSITQTLDRTSMITADYSGTAKFDLTSSLNTATSVGGQFNNTEVNTSAIGGSGFPAPGVEVVSATSTPVAATQSATLNTNIGGYVQEQVAWRDLFFLTGGVRVDNNSAFGANFKWVTYPKVSASWVVSDESFWHWSDRINTLRLRAAYGASGRQPSTFSALQTFTPVVGPGGTNAVTAGNLGNSNLRPERSIETELGFEGDAFSRFSFNVTYYNKNTSSEIVNQPVAPSSGFSGSQLVNLGKVHNNGVELDGTFDAIRRRSFTWSINANLTTIHNEIKSNIPTTISNYGQYNIVGYPLGSWWARRAVSVDRDPTTGSPIATSVKCDSVGKAVACGTAPFEYIGTPTPKLTGAVGNTFTIGRSWRFYALVDFKRGHNELNQQELIRCAALIGVPLCRANYYPQEFGTAYLAETVGNVTSVGDVDQYMQNASFTKLREVSATYTLPRRFLGLASPASVTLAGRELHLWTNYRGLDPEIATAEQATTPPLARFIVTLNYAW
ncbi:MAG: SusC/RagA family TonB-linked outer membrane protein [Gemmatimonadaceae bacterium]